MNNFNFTATAVLFLNDVKEITPKKGDSYIAIKGNILEGDKDSPNYESIDLIVSGNEAKELLNSLKDRWSDKMFASAKIGSLSVKPFLKKSGEAGAVLSGRILKITYLKVGDDVVLNNSSENTQDETPKEKKQNLKATYTLSEKDPNFEKKKDWLISNGYEQTESNNEKSLWANPRVAA